MYVGDTRTDIKKAAEGHFDVSSETEMAFPPDKTKTRHARLYSEVTELEYGQKAGRRVAVALLVADRDLLEEAQALPDDLHRHAGCFIVTQGATNYTLALVTVTAITEGFCRSTWSARSWTANWNSLNFNPRSTA
jgi:hypothetical protein